MTRDSATYSFSYDQSLDHLEAQVAAVEWRDAALTQAMTEAGWLAYFKQLISNQAYLIGFSAAVIAWLSPIVISDFEMPRLWTLAAFGVVVGLTAFAISHYLWRTSRKQYINAFMEWSIGSEIDNAKKLDVKIGEDGIEVRSATDIVVLTWHRFMIGYKYNELLVLIFQGSIYTIPAQALPMPIDEVLEKISVWSETYISGYSGSALSKAIKKLSKKRPR